MYTARSLACHYYKQRVHTASSSNSNTDLVITRLLNDLVITKLHTMQYDKILE